ncbi:MAG: hypothetical protein HOV79_02115 [Hamadaea sp.]|nr:hypothetical protein [Hamadaea sp.]
MYQEGPDRWRLKDIDYGGDKAELREQALAELAKVGGRSYRAPSNEEAGDESDTVRVAVDQANKVVDVHIRSDWRERLGAGGLGPALIEARKNAAAAMARARAMDRLAAQEREAVDGPETDDWKPLPYVEPLTIDQVWQRLSDNEDRMYRTTKRERAASAGETRSVGGALGLLSGRIEGRNLVSIVAEPMRLQHADTEQLRSAALDLFEQAETREWEEVR